MKVELGGGTKPIGGGFVNVDWLPCADVHCDLAAVGRGEARLPFDDDSVDALYTAHTLEHLPSVGGVIHEIARICRVGAHVEIRLPHWLHDSAMADAGSRDYPGHFHSYGVAWWYWRTGTEEQEAYWPGTKQFAWTSTHYQPERCFEEAKAIFGKKLGMTDEQIFRFIPGTAHEVHYHFTVIAKETL